MWQQKFRKFNFFVKSGLLSRYYCYNDRKDCVIKSKVIFYSSYWFIVYFLYFSFLLTIYLNIKYQSKERFVNKLIKGSKCVISGDPAYYTVSWKPKSDIILLVKCLNSLFLNYLWMRKSLGQKLKMQLTVKKNMDILFTLN